MGDSSHIVGEVYDLRKQTSVEWKIVEYFSLSHKADSVVESPTFLFANASWCLRIFPNGERYHKSVEWMGLYLRRLDSGTENISVNFRIGIKSENGEIHRQAYCSYCFKGEKNDHGYGYPKFISTNQLIKHRKKMVPGNLLTVFCIVKNLQTVSEAETQTVSVDGVDNLVRDFYNLLHNPEKPDVKIKVKNKIFPAHKLILGTRSAVFAAMFRHDMKENSSGVVNIDDCDPDVFRKFLLFIYAGKIGNLTPKNVIGLYTLADKYDLTDLKQMCVDFMKNNLCLEVVCDVMTVAYKHNEEELKKCAKELITNNIKTLIPTNQWIWFMRDNPLVAAELLMTVIPDKNS